MNPFRYAANPYRSNPFSVLELKADVSVGEIAVTAEWRRDNETDTQKGGEAMRAYQDLKSSSVERLAFDLIQFGLPHEGLK